MGRCFVAQPLHQCRALPVYYSSVLRGMLPWWYDNVATSTLQELEEVLVTEAENKERLATMSDQVSNVEQLQEELLVLHDYYNDSQARV